MAATIIHVGVDDCHRIPVLKMIGYTVNDCTTFEKLHAALIGLPSADAVAIAEGLGELPRKAISLARATVPIPLILFQTDSRRLDESDFDLVVPPLSPPQIWIAEIERLVEESRALRAESKTLQEESRLLREQSSLLRKEAASAREKSRLERQRAKVEVAKNRQKLD